MRQHQSQIQKSIHMTTTDSAAALPREYKDTLFLPDTEFPMKAGLPKA